MKVVLECLKFENALDGQWEAIKFVRKGRDILKYTLGKLILFQHLGWTRRFFSEICSLILVDWISPCSTKKTEVSLNFCNKGI